MLRTIWWAASGWSLMFLAIAAVVLVGGMATAEDWPQWRGPHGDGTSRATGLPTEWGPEENIVWKTPLPSWSGATPVVWGDRVFVTSPSASEAAEATEREGTSGDRTRRGGGGRGGRSSRSSRSGRDPGGKELLLICLSKTDGERLWQRQLDDGNRLWRKQNASSPSPVTDGQHVWAVTGTGAVAAFDTEGTPVWQTNLQRDYGKFGQGWGYASSPLLHDGKLIIEVLHGSNADHPSYLVAFDAETGRVVWREERWTDAPAESPDAYTTPTLLSCDGKWQIVVSGGDYVTGHDPETGKEIWRAAGLNPENRRNFRIIASPVVADGMIYAPTRKTPLLALRSGGSGDITTSHLAWQWQGGAGPDVPTPVSDGRYFYMVDDRGLVTCLNAKSGQLIWGPQRTAPGTVSASPLLADGKLYITNEQAVTTVLVAGPKFQKLASNQLDGTYTLASIAVAGRQLLLRTSVGLYCIGE
jgi:outer membrane protein assembly factor BamB